MAGAAHCLNGLPSHAPSAAIRWISHRASRSGIGSPPQVSSRARLQRHSSGRPPPRQPAPTVLCQTRVAPGLVVPSSNRLPVDGQIFRRDSAVTLNLYRATVALWCSRQHSLSSRVPQSTRRIKDEKRSIDMALIAKWNRNQDILYDCGNL
jgi:hypothetical protein